jgi:hypothetical protein
MLEGSSDFSAASNALSAMNQRLFDPDDAKGWDWGLSWIGTGTYFARSSLANTLATNRAATGTFFSPNALLLGQNVTTADQLVNLMADRLNINDAASDTKAAWVEYVNANDDGSRGVWTNTPASVDKKMRGLVHLMLTSPAFQMA